MLETGLSGDLEVVSVELASVPLFKLCLVGDDTIRDGGDAISRTSAGAWLPGCLHTFPQSCSGFTLSLSWKVLSLV